MGLRGERHAGRCPGLSIRTLHAAPMMAAERGGSGQGRGRGRSSPPLSAPSESSDNRPAGRSPVGHGRSVGRSPAITLRLFVSFGGGQNDDLCGPPSLLASPLCPRAPSVPLHSWHKTKDGSPFSAEPTKGAQKGGENERGTQPMRMGEPTRVSRYTCRSTQ